jgi:hypothetical protein
MRSSRLGETWQHIKFFQTTAHLAKGATIDSANNTSANYDALVEGGHLEEVKHKQFKPVKDGN